MFGERASSQGMEGGKTGIGERKKERKEKAKYKPICLLNGMGKLYQGMLAERLRKDVRRTWRRRSVDSGPVDRRSTPSWMHVSMLEEQIWVHGVPGGFV